MAGLIDELVNTMSLENDIYKELIPIVSEKTQAIINNDLTTLQSITDKEQLTIERIGSLERKREEVIKNIGIVLSRDPSKLDMKELIRIMAKQPEEQRKLAQIHDELSATIKTLVRLNERNKALIDQSLEMINFNINILQSTRVAPSVNSYTRGAHESAFSVGSSGMFDTKQ